MIGPTRLVYFSPEQAAALAPDRARALVVRFGDRRLAASIDAARASDPPDSLAVARLFWARPVQIAVANALDLLARFGTPCGRDALVEAARDMTADTTGWYDEGPVDLAARLLCDGLYTAGIFERAQLRLARLPPDRPTYELRAADPRRVNRSDAIALSAALADVVGAGPGAVARPDARPWCEIWMHYDDEGAMHVALLYAAPAEDGGDVGDEGPTPGTRRALRCDTFRYLVADGRLLVTTSRPMLLRAYTSAWGRALHGDEAFFLDAPSVTLKPLQALGPRGLAAVKLPKGLERSAVIACQLDTGRGDRIEGRGPDPFARLGPHLRAGGHLTRATLRFYVEGEAHPVDAHVEIPDKLTVGVPDARGGTRPGARLARQALAELGVLSPGKLADDVTTLLPLVHPEWRWRAIAGDDGLAAMRACNVLEPVPGEDVRRVASESLRRIGRSAIAYRLYPPKVGAKDENPILRAAYYAVAEDWSIPAASIHVSAMGMLRLRLDRVVAKGAREMGLERGEKGAQGETRGKGSARAKGPALPKGVWWVGDLRVESGVVRFFYVVRAAVEEKERIAVGKAIARAAGFGKAVAFVPKGRKLGRDFVEIELDVKEQLGATSWRGRFAEAVEQLGLEKEVPVERLVPEGVRLVVDARQERVVLDGVALVALGESGYKMLRLLASRGEGSEIVPPREVDRAISGARGTDGAARTAAYKMAGWIAESFTEAQRPVPRDVEESGLVVASGRKGWRLTVRGVVR